LKQRKVYRVALGYAVVAWLFIQISATVIPAYHAPEWILPIFITVIALGFPVALVLAWAFEVKGGIIEKTTESTGRLAAANKGRIWLLAAIGLMFSAFAVGGYWFWNPWRKTATAPQRTSAAASAVAKKSIAVLPFENLSEDKTNAYFADGIQEEILTRLAKIADLKVISRNRLGGPALEEELTLVRMIFGENSRATSTLTRLLQTPYNYGIYTLTPVTATLLRLDPLWDPLRADPAFQKLCEETQP
jgi:hypothetical protein